MAAGMRQRRRSAQSARTALSARRGLLDPVRIAHALAWAGR